MTATFRALWAQQASLDTGWTTATRTALREKQASTDMGWMTVTTMALRETHASVMPKRVLVPTAFVTATSDPNQVLEEANEKDQT